MVTRSPAKLSLSMRIRASDWFDPVNNGKANALKNATPQRKAPQATGEPHCKGKRIGSAPAACEKSTLQSADMPTNGEDHAVVQKTASRETWMLSFWTPSAAAHLFHRVATPERATGVTNTRLLPPKGQEIYRLGLRRRDWECRNECKPNLLDTANCTRRPMTWCVWHLQHCPELKVMGILVYVL